MTARSAMSDVETRQIIRPQDSPRSIHALVEGVQIEPHGYSGLDGRPAGAVRRALEPTFPGAFWLKDARPDQHVGFVADVVVPADGTYRLAVQASGAFRLRIDAETIVHGPLRYAPALPEYHEQQIDLPAGRHRFALHAQAELLTTRMSAALPPFGWVRLIASDDVEVPLVWRGRELEEYHATGLRVSPLLGWVEWQAVPFTGAWWDDDLHAGWSEPTVVDLSVLGSEATRADIALPAWRSRPLTPHASGTYRDTYVGYEFDDIATQFLLADDNPDPLDDLDGQWFRYDLGRVRVGSVALKVASSARAEVTVGFAERLTPDGRPSPVVALSAGPTRMLQHFTVDSGETTIEPLQSLGGRYVEVRVRGGLDCEVTDARFIERDFLGVPTGRFESGDPLLDRIWMTGLETLRATAEDSLIDSVRERGEWVGDVVSSALHLLSAGWGDVRLVRRALLHSAAGARDDGLVSGCGPGEVLYLGTYAAQWVTACINVARVEGDLSILRELEESAKANIGALLACVDVDGKHHLPWSFVDWGYGVPKDQPNLAVIAHVHQAVRSWRRWLELLDKPEQAARYAAEEERLAQVLTRWMVNPANPYHSWTLGVHSGIVDPEGAAQYIQEHVSRAFPFDSKAARLRDGTQVRPGAATPYFTNYSFPILLDTGRGQEVADMWRTGWGWMLDRGATTWWEVFDERWSQCHYWGGAPTWQMSRWGLGLHLDIDDRGPVADLRVNDLGRERISGLANLAGAATAEVEWEKAGDEFIRYRVNLSDAARVRVRGEIHELSRGGHEFELRRQGGGALYR
ncbi:family 78 glycoside hydrolase catalytic domain [Microbacterium sp. R86528]|uniref:family 78 glycoside hydrolase catalytic domain n=1 Tax=Microbacterium sp. R86528 TaxID=3093864 RepID=UPI0037C9E88F